MEGSTLFVSLNYERMSGSIKPDSSIIVCQSWVAKATYSHDHAALCYNSFAEPPYRKDVAMNSDARAQRRQQYLMGAFDLAARHLTRYGENMVSGGQGKRRRRWSQQLTLQAAELLHAYFFAKSYREIRVAEERLEFRVVRQVRLRFTNSCIQRMVINAPGQRQRWYGALAVKTKAFLSARNRDKITAIEAVG